MYYKGWLRNKTNNKFSLAVFFSYSVGHPNKRFWRKVFPRPMEQVDQIGLGNFNPWYLQC